MSKIFLATQNKGKLKEYPQAFESLKLHFETPFSLGIDIDVEESGQTFEDNALTKARAWATQTNITTLADDAGLSIDSLNGFPGINSHRFMVGTDTEKNLFILNKLKDIPTAERTAYYTCALAFVDPVKHIEFVTTGYCYGSIALDILGRNGFGFDPIFIPKGYKNTIGELPEAVKLKISHRAKALEMMSHFLKQWI